MKLRLPCEERLTQVRGRLWSMGCIEAFSYSRSMLGLCLRLRVFGKGSAGGPLLDNHTLLYLR